VSTQEAAGAVKPLSRTFGASLIASSAYQIWLTWSSIQCPCAGDLEYLDLFFLEPQLRLDYSVPGRGLLPSPPPKSGGSEPETEEDDPEISLRIRDRQFIINAADAAWRAGAAAGIVGLPGLLLEERITRKRGGYTSKGRKLIAGGGSLGIREAGDEDQGTTLFCTAVAHVKPGSVAYYAGAC
jgi:hypothetical protein